MHRILNPMRPVYLTYHEQLEVDSLYNQTINDNSGGRGILVWARNAMATSGKLGAWWRF